MVLGEVAKWVTMSPQQVLAIESVEQSGETRIRVQGGVGEGVVLGFGYAIASNLRAAPLYMCTVQYLPRAKPWRLFEWNRQALFRLVCVYSDAMM